MANKKSIQFLRGTNTAISNSTEILEAGQPLYNTTTGELYVGDGSATQIKNQTGITANKTKNALTFSSAGTGAANGIAFDGSTARTISYNTIGAAKYASKQVTPSGTNSRIKISQLFSGILDTIGAQVVVYNTTSTYNLEILVYSSASSTTPSSRITNAATSSWTQINITSISTSSAIIQILNGSTKVLQGTYNKYLGFNFTTGSGKIIVTALYPIYEGNTNASVYYDPVTITFNANGGTPSTYTGTTSSSTGCLTYFPSVTKDGYSFLGWYTSSSGGEEVTTATQFTTATTIYAQWEELSYEAEVGSCMFIDMPYGDSTYSFPSDDNFVYPSWSPNLFTGLCSIRPSSPEGPTNGFSFTLSEDGQTLTVEIPYGLEFADGTVVTADNYVTALWLAALPEYNGNMAKKLFKIYPLYSVQYVSEISDKIQTASDESFIIYFDMPVQLDVIYCCFSNLYPIYATTLTGLQNLLNSYRLDQINKPMQAQPLYELSELDFSYLDTSNQCEFLYSANGSYAPIIILDKSSYDSQTVFNVLQNDDSICLASHLSFFDDIELYNNIANQMSFVHHQTDEEVLEIAVLPGYEGIDAENTTLIIQWLLYILRCSIYDYMSESIREGLDDIAVTSASDLSPLSSTQNIKIYIQGLDNNAAYWSEILQQDFLTPLNLTFENAVKDLYELRDDIDYNINSGSIDFSIVIRTIPFDLAGRRIYNATITNPESEYYGYGQAGDSTWTNWSEMSSASDDSGIFMWDDFLVRQNFNSAQLYNYQPISFILGYVEKYNTSIAGDLIAAASGHYPNFYSISADQAVVAYLNTVSQTGYTNGITFLV